MTYHCVGVTINQTPQRDILVSSASVVAKILFLSLTSQSLNILFFGVEYCDTLINLTCYDMLCPGVGVGDVALYSTTHEQAQSKRACNIFIIDVLSDL